MALGQFVATGCVDPSGSGVGAVAGSAARHEGLGFANALVFLLVGEVVGFGDMRGGGGLGRNDDVEGQGSGTDQRLGACADLYRVGIGRSGAGGFGTGVDPVIGGSAVRGRRWR